MSGHLPRITLHPKKERSLLQRHPWVFSGAIRSQDSGIREGDLVEVCASDGQYLATGHFHEGSIKVRLIAFERTTADQEFWNLRIAAAYELRERLGLTDSMVTNAYRLVHGEGDELPGLIIDIYGNAAVIQCHSQGMYAALEQIAAAVRHCYGDRIATIFDKSADTLERQTDRKVQNRFLLGEDSYADISENGVRFRVEWVNGQKTGFFLDQRENRELLRRYAPGRAVLNTFSYSGGFSMYAGLAGARSVVSVDSSRRAVEACSTNAELNGLLQHTAVCANVFDFLKAQDEPRFDLIVLDPPAFAKHLSSVENAMIGYRNLNTEGFRKIRSGGILFTFSCSQVMDKVLFRKVVFQAALQARRSVRILHQLSQGPDHPVNIYHPEGEYLKGLVLCVS
jgi:23S rRNA (cytosine1962-C5)-methyltransferase